MLRRPPRFPRPATLAGIMESRATRHPADYLASLRDARWGRDRLPDRAERLYVRDALWRDAYAAVQALDRDQRYGDHCFVSIEEYCGGGRYAALHYMPDLKTVAEWLRFRDLSILDTETTGLHCRQGDRVVSLSVLDARMRGSIAYPEGGGKPFIPQGDDLVEIRAEHGWTFNPGGRRSTPQALAVHGLSDEELAQHPPFSEHAREILGLLMRPDRIVVAHNAPFDLGFLSCEFFEARETRPHFEPVRALDTRALSKKLWPGESGSLDALAARLGVDVSERADRHTAGGDARILARCLPGLLDAVDAEIVRQRKVSAAVARDARRAR